MKWIFLSIALCVVLFAQSNYEILLSRPDITGLTGGGATNLDGIATTGLATGAMLAVYDGSETRIYRLTAGTDAESSPTIIRPDDFTDPGNAKVWKARLSSDPGETGYSGGGGSGITLTTPAEGLTGGAATNLDGIATTGLAIGTIVSVTYPESIRCSNTANFQIFEKDSIPQTTRWLSGGVAFDSTFFDTVTSVYILHAGTDTECEPDIIRPDDYAAGTNEKIWKQIMSSGAVEGFARMNDFGVIGVAESNFGEQSAETITTRGITWNTTLNRFDVHTSGIYEVTCLANVELPNNTNEEVLLRIKVDGVVKNLTQTITYVGFNFGKRLGTVTISWVGPVYSGQNISVTIDARQASANTGFWPGSILKVRKLYNR